MTNIKYNSRFNLVYILKTVSDDIFLRATNKGL